MISKILEKGILERFGYCMGSSDSQFGIKKRVGCSHAIYTLNSVINYFVDNGSTVNICSLDLAKAFDRSNHFAIFCKLIDRNMPVNIIMILVEVGRNCELERVFIQQLPTAGGGEAGWLYFPNKFRYSGR